MAISSAVSENKAIFQSYVNLKKSIIINNWPNLVLGVVGVGIVVGAMVIVTFMLLFG